jgi:fido (protein-threonine AMPylation protein)
MPEDPYSDPVTGVLFNKLGLGTAAELEAAEREITHAGPDPAARAACLP